MHFGAVFFFFSEIFLPTLNHAWFIVLFFYNSVRTLCWKVAVCVFCCIAAGLFEECRCSTVIKLSSVCVRGGIQRGKRGRLVFVEVVDVP